MKSDYLLLKILLAFLLLVPFNLLAQEEDKFNYHENKVPEYVLPALLESQTGKSIRTQEDWQNHRRGEILELFGEHVYGKKPEKEVKMWVEVQENCPQALNGNALSKQVKIFFSDGKDTADINLLIYLPHSNEPVPLFVGLNYYGNHTIHPDPSIAITNKWTRNNSEYGIENNRANEKSRGVRQRRWPVERILDRGYGLATIHYGDIAPDNHERQGTLQKIFSPQGDEKPDDHWGTIGLWAWGLSRAMDYFEKDPDIDNQKIAVIGHSRLGKTALWAGAQDQRFALVISNNSGCGGAALSRRKFGETVARINNHFPHWFCKNFSRYNQREEHLPLDQHMLIALIAPRPAYVASAEEDLWADPRGEFLSAKHAAPVYKLFGKNVELDFMPTVNHPQIKSKVGYHVRTGKHDITPYDWEIYLDFADYHLRKPKK